MEEPDYHGEIPALSPDRQQTLSVDILRRAYKDVLREVVCLSAWNVPDDYDPSAEIDLSPAHARKLAEQLRRAADVLEGAGRRA